MNDIEVLKVVENALRDSARSVEHMGHTFSRDPAMATGLIFAEAAVRIHNARHELDSDRDKQARQMLAGLGIIVPEFLAHNHEPPEHTGIYHETSDAHNGYPRHWHYRDADGVHVGTEQGAKAAYAAQASQPVVHYHDVSETADPMAPFSACCGYNVRSLLQAGDRITGVAPDTTCPGREGFDAQAAVRAEAAKIRYSAPLVMGKSNDWQRLAMVLVAQQDDLTHEAVAVSDADLMGVDGLNICWRRDPATDKNVYWLEDPASDAAR